MKIIQDYTILEIVDREGKTVIYRGEYQNKIFILKTFQGEYPTSGEIAQLQHEYQLAKALNISGIIKPHLLQICDDCPILVYENFPGKPLKQYLRDREISVEEFLKIAIGIVRTLQKIHDREIIHKNMTPQSIWIEEATGRVKITDFSLASSFPLDKAVYNSLQLTRENLLYISPEQTGRMNRALDYRSDFYSLGIIFYEMLAGFSPCQSEDPMKLIHCHLAKRLTSLHQLNPRIPQTISNLIDKLICKIAEDRYQSSYGIQFDLEICLSQWKKQGTIELFSLGDRDISKKLRIPQKLYEREREIAILLNAFENINKSKNKLILISGLAGIGKTALVNKIYQLITQRNGYFVSGKFSHLKTDIPYYFLIQAFRELILQILTESEEKIQTWKEKLLEALGLNGQLMIDVIPEVELIIGKQPTVAPLSAPESKNRFQSVIKKFISVFSQKDRPLILFFDDLQWSDFASLKLIHLLITQSEVKHLLIIGTYRSNEVNNSHPLKTTINNLELLGVKVENLVLKPLELDAIAQLITETFYCQISVSRPLAELILEKTNGNPFFINQLLQSLYKEKSIAFNLKNKCWQWNLDKIKKMNIADNIVEFMIDKIKKLSISTQETLKIAACIGHQFSLNKLSVVSGQSSLETANNLWEALDKGLILPTINFHNFIGIDRDNVSESELEIKHEEQLTYYFVHDRVQQATYSLLSKQQKEKIHFQVGNLILINTPQEKLKENIFDIVNHLNLGIQAKTSQFQKEKLARLNLIAGKKAKSSTAYEASLNYLETALNLLSKDSWETHYQLSFQLHLECSECEYLSGQFYRAEKRFDLILDRVHTKAEKAKVYILKITLYTDIGKLQEAIEIGLECLSLFKINIDRTKLKTAINKEIKRINTITTNRQIEDLSNLPKMTNKNSIAIMNLLMSLAGVTYFTNLELWTLLMLKMINKSLRYGNSEVSSFAYSAYGLIVGSALGNYQCGYEFGQLAIKVNKKFENVALWSKVYFMVGAFINHWKQPIQNNYLILRKAFQYGLETGVPSFCAYSVNVLASTMYFQGYPLAQLSQELEEFLEYVKQVKNIHGIYFQKLLKQVILSLQDLTFRTGNLSDRDFDEDNFLQEIKKLNLGLHLSFYSIAKMQLLYLFGDYKRAIILAQDSEKIIGYSFGLWRVVEHYFYYSLTLISLLRQSKNHSGNWQILLENLNKFKTWSDNCPENFLHKYLLISAEMACLSNQVLEAIELYDRAIAVAKVNNFLLDESLANELAGKFYLTKGKDKVAKVYLEDAYYGYLKWGAIAKARNLQQNYSLLLSKTFTPIEVNFSSFDLSTILKAYQAISSEFVLGKLLETLMKIAIENAGAQKGFLIFEKEGKWVIEAEGAIDSENVTVLRSLDINAIDSSTRTTFLSVAIVNYAIRTKQDIVLNNATCEKQFILDSYITTTQPKSILCLPLLYQRKLSGILYLENNLITDAFTLERVEILKIISSQAAISIENSRLYERLEDYSRTLEIKVEERMREIQRKNEELANTIHILKKTQAQIIAQEKLASLGTLTAGIAHEIKNPLNFVNNFAELSIELAKELSEEIASQKNKLERESLNCIDEIIDDLCQNAQKINEHGKRADKIVRGMLMHSRGESASRQPTNLNTLLFEAVNLIYHGMRAKDTSFNISIETDFDDSLELVDAIAQDISRVFLNIIDNACYAAYQKKIELQNNFNGKKPDFIPLLFVSTKNLNSSIEIRIRDNGKGISPEIADKIFTPFFTTKPTGEGTGLGLSIGHDIIVQTHQGDIRVKTEVDRYTEFIITLPKTVVPNSGYQHESDGCR